MNESSHAASTPRDRRNSRRYVQLSLLWALVYVGCTYALAFDYVEALPLRWLLVFVPSVFACFSVGAYWRYLHGMDELLRAIELRALAQSIAAGFVTWPALELLENGMALDIDVPVTLLVMTGFYAFGVARGRLAHL
jgi:hypothetical protein